MSGLEVVLQSMRENIATSTTVEKVFGQPIQIGNKTIIPVAQVGFGFGAGQGRKQQSAESPMGSGAGGGGGVRPIGVLEVTDTETRFIRFSSRKTLASVALLGFAAGMLFNRLRAHPD